MRLIFCFLSLGISVGAFGQITAGRKFIGGNLQYRYNDNTSATNSRDIGLSPLVGFVLNDKWAVGPMVSYTNYRSSTDLSPDYKSVFEGRSGSVGVFGRRYMAASNNVFFFVHGQLSYGRRRQENYSRNNGTEFTTTMKSNVMQLGFRPGIAYFLNPKWAVEGSFGLLQYEYTSNSTRHNVDLSLGSFAFSISRFF